MEFTGAALDTLVALIEKGPLDSGDLPSKIGRDELLKSGLAYQIIAKKEQGYVAASYQGLMEYLDYFEVDTIEHAIFNRKQRINK